jgi:hypothetical protein
MKSTRFLQYSDDELRIVSALDRELANEIFSLHRQGYDMSEVLHEARWFKAEGEMMKKELQRRNRGGK